MKELTAFTLDPEDGTVYRAVYAPVGVTAASAAYVGPGGVFFAFGVGNRPVTGFFFHKNRRTDFGYFYEKMQKCADGYVVTVYMAWLVLLVLLDQELPVQLPAYGDDSEIAPLQNWYESLNPLWIEQVRTAARQSELEE